MSSLSLSEISTPLSMMSSSLKKILTIPFLMAIAVFPFLSDQDIFSFASCSKFTIDMFEDQFFSYENKWFSNIDSQHDFHVSKSLLKRMKKKKENIVNLIYMLEQNDQRINLAKFIPTSVSVLQLWTGNSFYYRKINLSSFTNLKHLEVPTNYNKPIKSFPPNLTVLKFESQSYFNKPLLNLPSSLRWLTLEDKFNQTIVLNEGLEYVRFGKYFNSPIESLPSTLIYLEVGEDFRWSNMKTELPESLREIRILRDYSSEYQYDNNSLIKNLIEIVPRNILNMMVGNLFSIHDSFLYKIPPIYKNVDSMRDYISLSSLEDHSIDSDLIRKHRIPFVLNKYYDVFQSMGKYVRIQHLFCREIQDFMENETMKSNFNLYVDHITKTSCHEGIFQEERLFIETPIHSNKFKREILHYSISD
jgi:hypothetical protein